MKQRMSLLLIGCLLAFLIGELLTRMAAHVDPTIRLLATSGKKELRLPHPDLDSYLESRLDQASPHREWRNYWTNSLGMNDEEFREDRLKGTLRVLALGDSFAYGMVAYPQNFLTLFEQELAARCEHPVEVMNFGIASSGVWDYHEISRFVVPRFRPDVVLVHLYLGNDPPDLLRHWSDIPGDRPTMFRSYVISLVKNTYRLLMAVKVIPSRSSTVTTSVHAVGGTEIEPQPLPTDAELFSKPVFSDEAYDVMRIDELGRFSLVHDAHTEAGWARMFEELTEIKQLAEGVGAKFGVVFLPSRIQLKDGNVDELIPRGGALDERLKNKNIGDFDLRLPNRMLQDFCAQESLTCVDLTPVFESVQRPAELYIPNDTHWRISGNELAGREEAKLLSGTLCRLRGELSH